MPVISQDVKWLEEAIVSIFLRKQLCNCNWNETSDSQCLKETEQCRPFLCIFGSANSKNDRAHRIRRCYVYYMHIALRRHS